MNRIVPVVIVLVFAATGLMAQSADAYLELMRSNLKTKKVALITEALQFSDKESSVFWPIYREFDLEASKIGDRIMAQLKDYATNYQALTNEKAEDLVEANLDIREERLSLMGKYFKKFSRALNPVIAARWYQVENQINVLIDAQIASQVPLIK